MANLFGGSSGLAKADSGSGGSAPPKPPSPSVPAVPGAPINTPTFDFGDVTGGGNPAAAKAAALRGIEIEKARLAYQKKSGLRDIGQAREEGLRGAINNALQRGIYRSGIRVENEAKVGRESDEAKADLQAEIGFALDLLKERAAQVKAGGGGGGTGGFSFGMEEIMRFLGLGESAGYALPTQPTPITPHPNSDRNQGPSGRNYGGGR